MDIKQLRYFLGILKSESYHRAGEFLHIAQPALSHQVTKLEKELSVKLFYRHSRGVRPTDAGLVLAKHAKAILQQVDTAVQSTMEAADEVGGGLAVGMPPSVGFALGPMLIERYYADYPKVKLKFVSSFNGHLQEWLLDGQLNLAVLYDAKPHNMIKKERLIEEELVFVASGEDHAVWKNLGSSSAFDTLPLILPSRGHGLRKIFDEAAAKHGLQPLIKVEVEALQIIKDLVGRGVGYSVLPITAVIDEVRSGRLRARPIPKVPMTRILVLARTPRHPLNKAARLFTQYVYDTASELCRMDIFKGRRGPRVRMIR